VAALCFTPRNSRLFELARVLVRLDHVAGRIVNVNHGIATESVSLCVRIKKLMAFAEPQSAIRDAKTPQDCGDAS